jgi:Flp pilus assembly protein protease CpaA
MIWFLIALALVWICFAVIQDFRTREVANWLNFSLVIFAIVIRLFYSLFTRDMSYFYFGIFGFGVFFVLAHLFYYSRVFAGGDAKLMIGLGAVIPFAPTFFINIMIFFVFVISFLFFGAVYSLSYSFFLAVFNFREFRKEFFLVSNSIKKYYIFSLFISFVFSVLFMVFYEPIFLMLTFISLSFPLLYAHLKAVEKSGMIKYVKPKDLAIGDWIVNSIKIKKKMIVPHWEGLSEEDIKFLRKNYRKKVVVKDGIPFTPAFLLAFLSVVLFYYLGYPYWSFFKFF